MPAGSRRWTPDSDGHGALRATSSPPGHKAHHQCGAHCAASTLPGATLPSKHTGELALIRTVAGMRLSPAAQSRCSRRPDRSAADSRERSIMPTAPSAAIDCFASASPGAVEHLEVVLLPGGHVSPIGSEPDLEATWEVLGQIGEAGTTMGFIRVEMAGVSWATLIPRD